MGERVRIIDVAPRDGLQNESGIVPTPEKARLVDACARTGVDEVEVTSFVSPKWIPQLGDAANLCELIAPHKPEDVTYSALVPNERGMERVLAVNDASISATGRRVIDTVSVFAAASETFSRRNTNASIAEAMARFGPVVAMANDASLSVRGYLSCVIACPFEGPIEPRVVARWAGELANMGIGEVDLGDTIGAGTFETTAAMLRAVLDVWANIRDSALALHLHDTFGRAGECVLAGLEAGVRRFDGSASGLGGCPYASTATSRAPGNIDTRILVRTIEGAGYTTGVAGDRLDDASATARRIVDAAREVT